MSAIAWLLLTYKVPPEPAARRIAIWRRLKGMGAIYLQNGVCLLPKTDDHVRRLKMLENDVAEAKGASVILETVALDKGQEEKVIDRKSVVKGKGVSVRVDLGGSRIIKHKNDHQNG